MLFYEITKFKVYMDLHVNTQAKTNKSIFH